MTLPIPPRARRETLPPEAEEWLRGGHGGAWKYLHPLDEVWLAHADRIVAEHVKDFPGTRPEHWWEYSAPEPRQRLGGIGTPLSECTCYAPSLHYGIPARFRRAGDDFEGRGLALDPADPPRYESQASYLLRLGLLLPGERALLCPRDFWPEQIEP